MLSGFNALCNDNSKKFVNLCLIKQGPFSLIFPSWKTWKPIPNRVSMGKRNLSLVNFAAGSMIALIAEL